jgi:hypothetical protein
MDAGSIRYRGPTHMRKFSPFTCCVNAVFVALVILYQLSIAGCTLRCLDSLYLSGSEGVIVDEETACIEKQGASKGFLLSPALTLVLAPIAAGRPWQGGGIHLPLPYLKPPLKPPESSRALV